VATCNPANHLGRGWRLQSALQERLQAVGQVQPQYILAAQSGPDHQKRFRIEVRVAGADGVPQTLASAEGTPRSKPSRRPRDWPSQALAPPRNPPGR